MTVADPFLDAPLFKLQGLRSHLSTEAHLTRFAAALRDEIRYLLPYRRRFTMIVSVVTDLLQEVQEFPAMKLSIRKTESATKQFLPVKSEDAVEKESAVVKMEVEKVEEEDKKEWLSDISLWSGASNCEGTDKEAVRKCDVASKSSGGVLDKGGGGMCFVPSIRRENYIAMNASVQLPKMPCFRHEIPLLTPSLGSSCAFQEAIHETFEGYRPTRMHLSGRIGQFSSTNLQQSMLEQQHQQQSSRKTRRCWSRELHRKFERALEELGGPEVATPKQIREVMKVEGLTNDEVKSHLQKYRMHAKKSPPPPPALHLDLHLKSSPVCSPDNPMEFSRFNSWQGQSESYGGEPDIHRCIGECSG